MKKHIQLSVCLLMCALVFFALPAYAGLKQGIAAMERRDTAAAIKAFMPLAKKGDPIAKEYLITVIYLGGNGAIAIKTLTPLAKQGDAAAQNYLGLAYMHRYGPRNPAKKRTYRKALYWFHKAIEQNHADAQFNLALMYSRGWGVAQDDKKSEYWIRTAAKNGHAQAQTDLGALYVYSLGLLPQDYKQALYWTRKAVKQDFSGAHYNLSLMYRNGFGVKQDNRKAAYWMQKAAEQNFAAAQVMLADMYRDGIGVKKSHKQAICWYRKAAVQDHPDARRGLEGLGLEAPMPNSIPLPKSVACP